MCYIFKPFFGLFRFHAPDLAGNIAHNAYDSGEFSGYYACDGKRQNYESLNGGIKLLGVPTRPIQHQ